MPYLLYPPKLNKRQKYTCTVENILDVKNKGLNEIKNDMEHLIYTNDP